VTSSLAVFEAAIRENQRIR